MVKLLNRKAKNSKQQKKSRQIVYQIKGKNPKNLVKSISRFFLDLTFLAKKLEDYLENMKELYLQCLQLRGYETVKTLKP